MEMFYDDDSSDASSIASERVSSHNADEEFMYSDNGFDSSDDDFGSSDSFSSVDSGEDPTYGMSISNFLSVWSLNFGISHNALTHLLQGLRQFGHNELPKHAKSLLDTPRTRVDVRECPPGQLTYFGIEAALMNMEDYLFENSNEVEIDFYIDGLSVHKSTKWEIWPVMGALGGYMNINPFLVLAYAGRTKPLDVNDYLREFSREIIALEENGVLCGKGHNSKILKIRCFICDAPAASFVTGRVGHSSKNGCPKCDQLCVSAGRRLLYQNISGTLRTDESFLFRDDTWHHRPAFLNDHSELEKAGIGMISQFVIDPMHNIDIGNTYKIIRVIIKNQCPISHLSTVAFDRMNERFISFNKFTPSEFERKPRTLKDLDLFTASELRQLLLYTLPVMLKGFVSEELHRQVLLFHTAVRLLDDPKNYLENLPAARTLIDLFVLQYSHTFGIKHFTYNTHCLLHIPDCVEQHGPLYSISAYKSENHMRILKCLLRKKHMHLQQFSNRFAEISNASELLKDAKARSRANGQFQYNNYILKANNLRDGCCMVQPGIPLLITGLREVNGTKIIQGTRFIRYEDFFDYPVSSIENLGIILASQLSLFEEEFPIDSVIHKYYRLPYEDKFVLIPLIHTSSL